MLLLPADPDASCARLRRGLRRDAGVDVGVVINDSLGRAWRKGTVGMALGLHGVAAIRDLKGRPDMFGRPLETSEVAVADELAAAASLVQGQADEATPIVHVRGFAGDRSGRPSGTGRCRSRRLPVDQHRVPLAPEPAG